MVCAFIFSDGKAYRGRIVYLVYIKIINFIDMLNIWHYILWQYVGGLI